MVGKKSDGIRYEDMLKEGWNNLEQVPDEHKTPELCMEFVKVYGHNLKYVPEEMKTREMCIVAYRNAPDPEHSILDIVASIPDRKLVFQCLVDSLDRPDAASFAYAMRPEQFDDRIADYLGRYRRQQSAIYAGEDAYGRKAVPGCPEIGKSGLVKPEHP